MWTIPFPLTSLMPLTLSTHLAHYNFFFFAFSNVHLQLLQTVESQNVIISYKEKYIKKLIHI